MSKRPRPKERKFVSRVVENIISEVTTAIADKELALLFENCFPNVLDTTVHFNQKHDMPDTFVITGDIPAMWLRDSSAQVWPYVSFADKDEGLLNLLAGVINRQTKCILLDPYANAFLSEESKSQWHNDHTEMKPGVFERKWEIDSLCYPVRLAYHFWKSTGHSKCFDQNWRIATHSIVEIFKEQQRKNSNGTYKFGRVTNWSTDTVPGNGYGNPVNPVGLIVSVFRPSDDATIFPFLIPSNLFAVSALHYLAEMHTNLWHDEDFAHTCLQLAREVSEAVQKYAIGDHLDFGKIYAFEVDGFGNRLLMDDANIPSLLSLPYLGCLELKDPLYQNTRKFILSKNNPYFFHGSKAEGIGSPHTLKNQIWPMSIIMRALTSDDEDEICQCLRYLKTTHGNSGFMHESFNKDKDQEYTRSWFGWANSLFGELILRLYWDKSKLLTLENL